MILGVGVDICQNNRIRIEMASRILNGEEKLIFDSFSREERKIEYLSGRFAVKEALIKAFSQANREIFMRDITILNDELNRPFLAKPVFQDIKIHLSISHETEYTIGFAIMETKR